MDLITKFIIIIKYGLLLQYELRAMFLGNRENEIQRILWKNVCEKITVNDGKNKKRILNNSSF